MNYLLFRKLLSFGFLFCLNIYSYGLFSDSLLSDCLNQFEKSKIDSLELSDCIVKANFKKAYNFKKNGKINYAVKYFKMIADSFPTHRISDRAIFEAATCYEDSSYYTEAIDVYKSLFNRFPKSNLVDKAFFRIANIYKKNKNYSAAIETYISGINHRDIFPKDSSYQREIKYLFYDCIANLYKTKNEFIKSGETYLELSNYAKNDRHKAIILFKAAELYQKGNQDKKTKSILTELIKINYNTEYTQKAKDYLERINNKN